MNDKVDHRRKAVCCMCGKLKRPFCWANRGLEEQPFCSWKCRKLYLYGPDVENASLTGATPVGGASELKR